jgi:hypothetical protein
MTREQKILLGAFIGIVAAFLIGFGWQYSRARSFENRLADVTRDYTFKRLEATLAAATIEAQRGNYELARRHSSDFFTALQDALPDAPDNARATLQRISTQRDAIITATSRSDTQAASILEQLYGSYRVAFGGVPVAPTPAPAPPTTTTTTTQ